MAGATTTAMGTEGTTVQEMAAELAQLRQQVQELRGDRQDHWLNERRAEEVKSLVREVLADADTRASLLEGGATAGHNGKHFFLANEDGSFLMEIAGQVQLRYIAAFTDNNARTEDDVESGFTIRRTKLELAGHIADPRLKYAVQLAVDRGDNTVSADKIVIAYELMDNLEIWAGEDKAPFLREEIISSKRQLAVERSYVNEIFTADKVQGVAVKWDAHEAVQLQAMLNDGIRSGDGSTSANVFTQLDDFDAQPEDRETSKDFNDDATDLAITARVDVKLAGDWGQWKDFTSWSDEELAVFVGAAIHWEKGETGDSFNNNDFLAYTIDASIETGGLNIYGAFMGMSTSNETDIAGVTDYDLWGLLVQAGYNIPMGANSLEPFARYEYIDFDGAVTDAGVNSEDEVSLITAGVNYYFKKHNAKFTADAVYALDPLPIRQEGLGLVNDGDDEDGQLVLRFQFQTLF